MIEDFGNLEESIYCGEYLQKNREKPDGKTYKRKYWTTHDDITLERHSNYLITQKYDKLYEVAVTDVDSFFDYGFWKKATASYPANRRPLNSPDKWENIQEFLENNAVKKTKEFRRYEGQCNLQYELPVTGHVLCENIKVEKNKKKKLEGWLFWNGKYYDPAFTYLKEQTGVKETLTKLCPVILGREDPLMQLGYTDESKKMNRIAKGVFSSRNRKRDKPYLSIDLGRVCVLDHIGTFGGYPKSLNIFPSLEGKPEKEKKEVRNWVYVVNSDYHLSWVTKYNIQYRDLVTGKWVAYEHPLDGNADVTTEVIHKISIVARYVRVIPLDFHHQKEMRVLLYGDVVRGDKLSKSGATIPSNLTVDKAPGKRRSKRTNGINEENEEEIETIRYTLHPTSSKWSLNQGCGRSCTMCHPRYGIKDRKQVMFRILQEEKDSWQDHFYLMSGNENTASY